MRYFGTLAVFLTLCSHVAAAEPPLYGITEWPIGRCDVDTPNPQSFHLAVELGIELWAGEKVDHNIRQLWFLRCSRILGNDPPGKFIRECSLVRQTLSNDPNAQWQIPTIFNSLDGKNLEIIKDDWAGGHLKLRLLEMDVVEVDVHFKCDPKSGEIRLTNFLAKTVAKAGNPTKYRPPEYRVPRESYSISKSLRINGLSAPTEKK